MRQSRCVPHPSCIDLGWTRPWSTRSRGTRPRCDVEAVNFSGAVLVELGIILNRCEAQLLISTVSTGFVALLVPTVSGSMTPVPQLLQNPIHSPCSCLCPYCPFLLLLVLLSLFLPSAARGCHPLPRCGLGSRSGSNTHSPCRLPGPPRCAPPRAYPSGCRRPCRELNSSFV